MSPSRIIILLLAAAAAAGAALLVRNMADQPAPAPQPAVTPEPAEPKIAEVAKTPVLVATRDMRVGALVTADDLEWREWPDETINVNQFTKDVAPDAMERVTGSVVRNEVYQGEPILPQKIVRKGETGFMAALLKPGMRAVSVEISADSASGGFILPGDRVDVMLSYSVELKDGEDAFQRPTTSMILENVRVLAIDQKMDTGEEGQFAIGSTATLELRPEEARLAVMAEQIGQVSLALRALQDAQEGGPARARTDFLLDVMPFSGNQTAAGRNASNEPSVTIYRNGQPVVETPQGS